MDLHTAFRDNRALKKEKFDDENISTLSSREQKFTEHSIEKCFERFQQLQCLDPQLATFYRDEHCKYLEKYIKRLPTSYECLDCSRPWNVYWTLNAAVILNYKFSDDLLNDVVDFLIKCRSPSGGFAGGPGQFSHLAPTYAAVNSLCIIGTEKAYEAIDRESLMKFLWSVRDADGSFRLHVDGEVDVRGAYCALACAKLVNITEDDQKELFKDTADWIASCQTYEGGFGGAPDLEAHGGYTFCGIAALVMLGATEKCDTELLLKWSLGRQMRYEGGFQGRTNKLVDGCYSFWVGACIPITQAIIAKNDQFLANFMRSSLFDRAALQEYILLCCQKSNGGLIDKPGKPQDLYHTCYTLSGVSISQHCEISMSPLILGHPSNELLPVHPLHNVPPMAVVNSFMYFKKINERQHHQNGGSSRSQSRETDSERTSDDSHHKKSQNGNRDTSVEATTTSSLTGSEYGGDEEFSSSLAGSVTNSSG